MRSISAAYKDSIIYFKSVEAAANWYKEEFKIKATTRTITKQIAANDTEFIEWDLNPSFYSCYDNEHKLLYTFSSFDDIDYTINQKKYIRSVLNEDKMAFNKYWKMKT